MEWLIYEGERVKLSTTHARKIVRRLGKIRSDIFKGARPINTRLIKVNLAMLGHKLGYKVYANGLTDEDLRKIDVECEWNPNKKQHVKEVAYSGFKYDFQKLLVCNAQLRLMIFQIKKMDDLINLEEYFNKAIQDYSLLAKGARFLFLAFFPKEEKMFYKEIKKKNKL